MLLLALPVKITNRSKTTIKTKIANEWYGGLWPPTNLYAAVIQPNREPGGNLYPVFSPVFLVGEEGELTPTTEIKPGESISLMLRMDWPGTGSVKGVPLVDALGAYKLKLLLIFEADGKRQATESEPIVLEHPASAPTTQPTSLWLEQVRKSLPKGWSVKPAATLPGVGNPVPGEAWAVTRDDPMRVTYSSPVGMMPQEQTFQIIIVAGPKVSADDYRSMVEFNKSLERKFRGNEATLNRMGRSPWWGQRTGENTNNPYLLPTHFDDEHSLSIACRQLTSSYYEFAPKEDKALASSAAAAGPFPMGTIPPYCGRESVQRVGTS